jgi:ubiquinone/menaquinone biosynthesis C-methylase UbiE
MIQKFNPRNLNSLNQNFRKKRFEFFVNYVISLQLTDKVKILDIGGTQSYWDNMQLPSELNVQITLLNLDLEKVSDERFVSTIGDATNLKEYNDNCFDIVFSNSVIEHLFSFENQNKMANEINRVGKYYFIQTPNRYFPLEPHWLFPFFQFLPYPLKVFLTNHFNLGHYPKCNNYNEARLRVDEVKLLSENNMKNLFPQCKIYREYFGGLVKSITSYSPVN